MYMLMKNVLKPQSKGGLYYYIPTTGVTELQAPLNNMMQSS